MPLRPTYRWQLPQSSLKPEPPVVVLAAPGSIGPRQRLTQALAAGSLLAVVFRPLPGPLPRVAAAGPIIVTNTNPSGSGSLLQAVQSANASPGLDTINFDPSVSGTIVLIGQIRISDSVQIIGPGPGLLAVSGHNITRVFYLSSTTPFSATISGLTIRDGFTANDGGGILVDGQQLILDHVDVVSNTTTNVNHTTEGGGVDIEDEATLPAGLTIRDSIISGNHADHGGGVYATYVSNGLLIQRTQVLSNTSYYNGGGIYIDNPNGNTTVEDSTIANNTAGRHGGGIQFYDSADASGASHIIRRTTISGNSAVRAGGLYIGNVSEPLVVENSTISGNHASGLGGGVVFYYNTGSVSIRNSTIAGNTSGVGAGGIEAEKGVVPITNTIIAGNIAPVSADISGTFQLRYDLVQITGTAHITDAGGNLFGLNPLLGPLANNGGPTQTHFPGHGSPAVNAGDPAFASPPYTDQRGDPRVYGGRIDIGAVETQKELFLPLVRR